MTNWAFQPLSQAAAEQTAGGGGSIYSLTTDGGIFAATGQTALPRAGRRVQAFAASYSVSGPQTALKAARNLAAEAGGFELTGIAAGLASSPRLAATRAAFSLAGPAIALTVSRKLQAGHGDFAAAGESAELGSPAMIAPALGGSFMLDGIEANFIRDYRIAPESGAVGLSGFTASANITMPGAHAGRLDLGLSISL
jgi:hypothetical protein